MCPKVSIRRASIEEVIKQSLIHLGATFIGGIAPRARVERLLESLLRPNVPTLEGGLSDRRPELQHSAALQCGTLGGQLRGSSEKGLAGGGGRGRSGPKSTDGVAQDAVDVGLAEPVLGRQSARQFSAAGPSLPAWSIAARPAPDHTIWLNNEKVTAHCDVR